MDYTPIDKGNVIFSNDAPKLKERKIALNIAYTFIFACISILLIPSTFENPAFLFENIPWLVFTSAFITLILFIWINYGIRLQPFVIYEKGISPSLKPWSKLFNKNFFIPYGQAKEFRMSHGKMVLKNGRKITIMSPFANYFTTMNFKTLKEVDRGDMLLKKLETFIDECNRKEARGESVDWRFRAEY